MAGRKTASVMKRFLLAARGFVTSKRFLSFFGHFLVLLVFIGAAWLLYGELKKPQYTLAKVIADLRLIVVEDRRWVVVASLLTVLNFVILVGYDWFAVRYVGERKLPLRKIALASFITYAFSLNFGASLFGTSIRYRLYSAWGVPLIKIIELLVILGLTFWFGVFTLAGIVFTAAPFEIPVNVSSGEDGGQFRGDRDPPAEDVSAGSSPLLRLQRNPNDEVRFRRESGSLSNRAQHRKLKIIPFHNTFWVGILLLAVSGSYVLLSAFCRKPLRVWRWRIPVPPLKLTLCQIVIACGDLIVAAAVLYALLPPIPGGYVRVLGVWMLAYVAVVISHVPGGYGVQERVVLAFWPGHRVFAAMIVFRVIYYWVPLAIASVLLGAHELIAKNGGEAEPATVPADK